MVSSRCPLAYGGLLLDLREGRAPFTIPVHYRKVDLTEVYESDLELHLWNEGKARWDTIPSVLDTGANTVGAGLDHLSTLAVLGKSKPDIFMPIVLRRR